ncbi:MAG: biotin--[acetyl-CoA-carboxylase] ligase [Cyclobacteriaceae bacterium]
MYKISEEIQIIGKQLIFLPKCRSTNDIAADMFKKGDLNEGGIIITNHQHAGKGQRGNNWISDENKNLTFSLLLKPHFISPKDSFALNMMVSVAILNALKESDNSKFKIKWPNDIYYNGFKVGGILIENTIQGVKIENSIIGIGINVNQNSFDNLFNATSLSKIFKRSFELNKLLNVIIKRIEEQLLILESGNYRVLRSNYLENLYWINEKHSFFSSGEFTGMIIGIDPAGRLMVDTENGLEKFNFKEIRYLE